MHAQRNAPERKYALTKIAPGDYLLPSNDGQTVWRIARYLDSFDRERPTHYWGVWRATDTTGGYVDTSDWDRWEMCSGFNATRQDAINDALRMGT